MNEETDDKQQPDTGPELQNLKALAARVEREEPAGQGEQVTGEPGQEAGPGRSLADYIPTEKLIAMAISMSCNNIKFLKKYGFTDSDAETLGNAWGPVLESLMPKVPDGPITNALLITGVVVGPKVAKANRASKKETATNDELPAAQQETEQTPDDKPDSQPQDWQPISSRKK